MESRRAVENRDLSIFIRCEESVCYHQLSLLIGSGLDLGLAIRHTCHGAEWQAPQLPNMSRSEASFWSWQKTADGTFCSGTPKNQRHGGFPEQEDPCKRGGRRGKYAT